MENNEETQLNLNKVTKIRELMATHNVQAYVIPHCDNHESEYIADCDERLAFITDFTGSNGFALILQNEALMWTDSRYYLQAGKQLKNHWQFKKMALGELQWHQYLNQNLEAGSRIGYDPQLWNMQRIETITTILKNHTLVPIIENLVDIVWGSDRPSQPQDLVISFMITTCRYLFMTNISSSNPDCKFLLTQSLDEIAWLLNLRGNDISYNPLFKSYLLVKFNDQDCCGSLFVDLKKVDQKVREYLTQNKITIYDYDQIEKELQELSSKVLISKSALSVHIFNLIPSQYIQNLSNKPITDLKGVKNAREQQGMRECHIRDATALISYFAWLEDQLVNKKNTSLNEYSGAQILNAKRCALPLSKGISFETISSIGPNAAVIHYSPTEKIAQPLNPDLIYLVDSGGQYYDGTTDVTRTVHFTTPTPAEKESFTQVLMGNLDVQKLIWPAKSKQTGGNIDVLARRHLWEDYGHGTGHGVGYFLNVHEGPHGISKYSDVTLELGMVVTDEPGYYEDGQYGIRIEDELMVVDKGNGFIGFENLTQVPYDRNLFDFNLLTKHEINYINEYHQNVYNKVSPLLQNDELALNYLKKHTTKIEI